MTATAQKIHPLDLLYVRSCTLAERVCEGTLPFIDAIDMAYSAAQFAGSRHAGTGRYSRI